MARLDPLLALIYDAAVDPDALEALTKAMTQELGGVSAMLTDVGTDGQATVTQWGHGSEMHAAYEAYYRQIDAWVGVAPMTAPGVATSVDRLMPLDRLMATEFYNDFLRRHGDMAHCLGAWAPVDGGVSLVSVQRSRSQGAFDLEDEARLQEMTPHLVRASAMRARLAVAEARSASLTRLLDRCDDCVIVLDAAGRVEQLNAAALQQVQAGRLAYVGGRLSIADTEDGESLARALVRLRAGPETSAPFTLSRLGWLGVADRLEGGRTLVVLRDPVRRRARQVQAAAVRYGLSRAETGLLSSLLDGSSPQDYAQVRDIKITTVRTQLSHLLAKAGVSRQSALVSLVSSLPTS